MVQHRSYIHVADNTGARWLQVIRVHGGHQKRYAVVGDVVTAVVKDAQPHQAVKKSDVVHVVIVRTKKEIARLKTAMHTAK